MSFPSSSKNNTMNNKLTYTSKKLTALIVLFLSCPAAFALDMDKMRGKPVDFNKAFDDKVQAAAAEKRESLPARVSIGQLLRIVREKSPRYALALNRIEAAQAEVVAADVLPNPTFSYGRFQQTKGNRDTQFNGPSQQQYNLSIPMLVTGQRGARVELAERRVEVAEAAVEVERTQMIRGTWRLFSQLLAGQEKVAVLEKAHQELRQIKAIISGRENAGAASRYDVLRIEQEMLNLEARLDNAHTDIAAAAGDLGVLLGFPYWKPQATGKLAPLGTPEDLNKLWQSAEQYNPEIKTAYRETIAADANLDKAERERWPVPALQLGTAYTDKPYGLTTYVGVAVDVPIFDRGQGNMARAEADKHAATLKRELLLAATRQELERAVNVLTRRRETLAKFEQQVMQPLSTLRKMSEDSYKFGKTNLLELLDASRTRTEIKLNYVDLLLAEIDAELDALMASGQLESNMPSVKE